MVVSFFTIMIANAFKVYTANATFRLDSLTTSVRGCFVNGTDVPKAHENFGW